MNNNDKYFLEIVKTLSKKSTCDRALVACIIVKNNYIISTGYNGAPRKCKHCDEYNKTNHLMKDGHCINTVHAEINAIINAAKNGISINDCKMYCSHKPCFRCMMALINSGITKCYYFEDYKDDFQTYFEDNKYCKFIKIK